jgi:hypothetical protein
MFVLTLIPDQPCDWHDIEDLLKKWNGSLQPQGCYTEHKACFSLWLAEDGQFLTLMDLQKMLESYGVSFFLEEKS